MRNISYIGRLGDEAILAEIGNFITQKRIQLQISQTELAERAALSRSTVSLVERGKNVSLNNLLKILRILDALYVLQPFVIHEPKSPLAMAKEEQKKKAKRVSRGKFSPTDQSNQEW